MIVELSSLKYVAKSWQMVFWAISANVVDCFNQACLLGKVPLKAARPRWKLGQILSTSALRAKIDQTQREALPRPGVGQLLTAP